MRRLLSELLCILVVGAPLARAADTSQFAEARGVKLYVETSGGGVPILFLHGGAVFFDNNFAAQRDYFACFRKVIGSDRRGHGTFTQRPDLSNLLVRESLEAHSR